MSNTYKLTADLSKYTISDLEFIKNAWTEESKKCEEEMLQCRGNVVRIHKEIEERKDDE